jgi:hypothetical protein
MDDHTKKGTAYLPAAQISQWATGIALAARHRRANRNSHGDFRSLAPLADPVRPTWDTTGHADSGR